MKKIMLVILILALLVCAGCSDTPLSHGSLDSMVSGREDSNSTVDNGSIIDLILDENAALFACQDRADIEGDRSTVYYYNYKGDLLKTEDAGQIGFYAKNGLAPAYDPISELVGFVDKSGVFVIEPRWDDAAAFSDNGMALVIMDGENYDDKKYGYINDKGEQIIPCQYDNAYSFYPCGLAVVGIDGEIEYTYTDESNNTQTGTMNATLWGVIDKTGNVIIEPQYEDIEHITENYIICRRENTCKIFDFSGNEIAEPPKYVDETHSYIYRTYNGKLYRYLREERSTEESLLDSAEKDYTFTEQALFDGKQFVVIADLNTPNVQWRHVATTTSGKGYGIFQRNGTEKDEGTVLIPFKYDGLVQCGSYYVGIRYKDSEGNSSLLDIYDKNFNLTAENLDYNINWTRTDPFGHNITLPDGYFDVYVENEEVDENVHGIIDYNGQIIVPLLYYRGIKLYTYEGVGGKFVP